MEELSMKKKFFLILTMFILALFCVPTIHGGEITVSSDNNNNESYGSAYIDAPVFYFSLHVESNDDGEYANAELKWTNAQGVFKNPHLGCYADDCSKTVYDGPRNGYVTIELHTLAVGHYGHSAASASVTW